ncbi:sugar lactone lactonase YvrE [Streptomyces netropsis]|uniref:Sugar lactone lactonase YvrE n=1 Tax=Streptomyces netropsis TaxID=55404 RepID=A0A7W7LGA5_STRNE|nr:SMP-30/gluconolactonase/LRE family protein [Streptomyces netropsis]MBB4889695.1 sugar lactone lactonase YvrE [Streptomyces netropsis]
MRPVVWRPPRPRRPPTGAGSPALPPLRLLPLDGAGPEHLALDASGNLLTGVADGRILRVDATTGRVEEVARTRGRPLGMHLLPDGRLLVCDAYDGLLRVDPATGTVETVLTAAAGEPLNLCSNVTVTRDGTVFVSDSSRRFPLHHWKGDILEHSGTGRVIRWVPGSAAEVVVDGLQFANGLCLAPDESFLVMAESGAYRLRRLWLTGDRAGATDLFADRLPGFPDNLTTSRDGLVWVALAGPRNALLDSLHRHHPALRRALWALPGALLPDPRRTTHVQGRDAQGRLVHDLRRRAHNYRLATSALEHNGTLYLGSLVEPAIATAPLPSAPGDGPGEPPGVNGVPRGTRSSGGG